MAQLSDGTTTVNLPEDYLWSDEFSWVPVQHAETRSVTGARIVQRATRIGGRPITLQPEDDASAWMTRADLQQLYAWAASPGLPLTLTLRGAARVVEFRYNEAAIEARPVVHYSDTDPGDHYLVTLRFTEQ